MVKEQVAESWGASMARLTAAARRKVPASRTGLPAKRSSKGGAVAGSYPMPDRKHAAIAKGYAKRFASPAQRAKIDARADKVLGKKGP